MGRAKSLAWVALAYVLAFTTAWVLYGFCIDRGLGPLYALALADVLATVVIFVFSRMFNNSSFYDPYWSIVPPFVVAILAFFPAPGVPPLRRILVMALVMFWGLRLTWNWLRSWPGVIQEDWRYVDLRGKTGRAYWLVSFFGLHLMPTATVFLAGLPLQLSLVHGTRPINHMDVLAGLLTASAVALETIADQQLWAFRQEGIPGRILNRGVWAYCRHPNYLGELGFWWGLFLFGIAADPKGLWYIAGPLWMTMLFLCFSIPLIDKRSLVRRPGYAEHMRRVPALIPRL